MMQDALLDFSLQRRGMAQSGSALDWGSRGHRFKSCCPDQVFVGMVWDRAVDPFRCVPDTIVRVHFPALRGLEHTLRVGARFVIPSDEHDTYTLCEGKNDTVYVIEAYPGGIGIVKKIFERWQDVLAEGVKLAENCACNDGCPYCILPPRRTEEIDKRCGLQLAHQLLDAGRHPYTHRFAAGMWRPV